MYKKWLGLTLNVLKLIYRALTKARWHTFFSHSIIIVYNFVYYVCTLT